MAIDVSQVTESELETFKKRVRFRIDLFTREALELKDHAAIETFRSKNRERKLGLKNQVEQLGLNFWDELKESEKRSRLRREQRRHPNPSSN